jgi:F-type H+-transporting ATPase subunit b
MLEINSSVFLQIANFLLLILLMNLFLYRPIRDILRRRNEEVSRLEGLISDFGTQSDRQQNRIEEDLVQARKDGYQEKEGLKGVGLKEERALTQEAGTKAEAKIGQAKREIEGKIAEVRKALEDQVSIFSKELAQKVLGRTIQ